MCERKSMPKHSEIMKYWRDKVITQDFKVTNELVSGFVVIKDWGEPRCWACKKRVNVQKYKGYQDNLNTDVLKIWDYKRVKEVLNRCHIVPKSLGGSFEPSNFFLLCKNCHKESPDTIAPEIFFSWVVSRRKKYVDGVNVAEMQTLFNEYRESFNLTLEEMLLYHDKNNTCFADLFDENSSTHGGSTSMSSIVGLYVYEYYKSKK